MTPLDALRRRYETYGHLMEEAAEAIAGQDDIRLAELAAAGADLLAETQRRWSEMQRAAAWNQEDARDDLASLRRAIAEALVRVTANRAALGVWLDDTRNHLQAVGCGRLATSGYRCGGEGDLAGCDAIA